MGRGQNPVFLMVSLECTRAWSGARALNEVPSRACCRPCAAQEHADVAPDGLSALRDMSSDAWKRRAVIHNQAGAGGRM